MKKHIANILRWLLTIAVFYYLFRYKVDIAEVWEAVVGANWLWFLPAVALFGATFFLGVLRWFYLLKTQGIDLPLRRVVAIGFVGHFFNSFLLGATGGDIIKAYYVARQTQTQKAEAVMSVFVDRVIGLLGLFVIALIMMAVNYHWLHQHQNLRGFTFGVFVLIVVILAMLPLTFYRGLPHRLPWLARVKEKIPMREQITKALNSYQSYSGHRKTLLGALWLSVGVHLTIIIGVICLGRGLGIHDVSMDKYMLIVPVINIIASIPITPSGFGIRENMYEVMFGDLGVPPGSAVALGLLSYMTQFVWSLVGGLVYMFWKHEPHMLQHAKQDLAHLQAEEKAAPPS